MALRAMYEKASDIPEALKSAYVEKDGKWVLDVEGMVPNSEVTSLKSKLDEFRSNNIQLNEQIKKFEGKKILSPEEQEEFDQLKEQQRLQKEKKLIDSGKIDELLAERTENMRQDYESRLKAMNTTLEETMTTAQSHQSKLSDVMIRSEVSQLLSDQGIAPIKGALEDIFARAGKTWRVNKEGKLVAVNEKGDSIYGSKGEELSLQEWGQSLVKSAPYLFAESRGADGKGSGQRTPAGSDGVLRIPRTDQNLKSKHIEDLASGKAVLVD